MLRADEPPEGIAVPIDRVVERLQAWGYPVALRTRADRASTGESTSGPMACAGGPAPRLELRSTPARLTLETLQRDLGVYEDFNVSRGPEGLRMRGALTNSFEREQDFVADCATGLMWQRGTAGPFTPEQAQQHVDNLNAARHGGFDDWRVPTAEELASLTQASGVEVPNLVGPLFLDPRYFDSRGYYCQSSDRVTDPKYEDHVVIVTWAEQGYFGFMPPGGTYPLKAVRTMR